jgi:phosphoribosyl-dephospho-CoA transferase
LEPLRHQLRLLSAAAWQDVLSRPWDDEARDCIATWAARDLPLVVTRQGTAVSPDRLAMGLSAPVAWGRRKIPIDVARDQTRGHDGFPRLAAIQQLLDADSRPAWTTLTRALDDLECDARVYGSHGWQVLTGMQHLQPGSDIDLLLPVVDATMADAVCDVLQASRFIGPRLDGEIVFADDAAVAWREWSQRGKDGSLGLLVKRTGRVSIETAMASAAPSPAPGRGLG